MSSEFTRGVLGVLAVGAIAGVGVLLLIPQPTPTATARIVDPPARSCAQSAAPTADSGCQKSAHRQGPDKPGGAFQDAAQEPGAQTELPDIAQARVDPPAVPTPEKSVAAPAKRSVESVRAAQRRKAESRKRCGGLAMT